MSAPTKKAAPEEQVQPEVKNWKIELQDWPTKPGRKVVSRFGQSVGDDAWRYVREVEFYGDSGYNSDTAKGRAIACVSDAFAALKVEDLPDFGEENVLRVTVEIARKS